MNWIILKQPKSTLLVLAACLTPLSAWAGPSSLIVKATSTNSIQLNWVNSNVNPPISIERSLSASSGFAVISNVAGGTQNYVNAPLPSDRTFFYRVRSYLNRSGRTYFSGYSNVASAKTFAASVPVVSLSPSTALQFADQQISTSSVVKMVTLKNTGNATLTFNGDFTMSGDFKFGGLGTCATSLAPAASCTASVVFTPTAAGIRTGILTMNDNAANSPQVIQLVGTGLSSVPAPVVSLSPSTTLQFADQQIATQSAVKMVTLTNTGNATLTINGDFTMNGDFKFGGLGTCATSLAPAASCTASVVFTPTAAGVRTGILTMNDNAANSPQVIQLVGTGLSSTPAPAPAPAPVPAPTLGSLPPQSNVFHLYVATTGSDSNPGTQASPLRTINKAGTLAKPGYLIHVADGTYNENVVTNPSGTSSNYIIFISDHKWGAKVVSSNATSGAAAWHNQGDNVAIIGFDITGPGAVGINHSGNDDVANQNHVHNIPATSCDGYGGGAIIFDYYNVKSGGLADSNLVHDIGPLGTNCYRVQGVYTSIPGVVISNNIIYKVVGYAVTNGHCSYNVKVVNNTLFNNGGPVEGGGIVITNNVNCPSTPSNGNYVANNIIFDNMYGVHEEGTTAVDVTIYTNNLVFGNRVVNWGNFPSGNPHVNNITANPGFVNYQPNGSGDYHLSSTSPTRNSGTSKGMPTLDFESLTRINFDMGALGFH